MVQYVLTPWRDRQELLLVRRQFYGTRNGHDEQQQHQHQQQEEPEQRQQRRNRHQQAVARVSMWVHRGNCPHMVESTGLLMAAVLSDEEHQSQEAGCAASSSAITVRAAYSAAFSRFVTGLLDMHQDKLRKQSMYSLAKTIGLPATFVELRHQSTHEQLPSLAKLRKAARKALQWIWEYYWQHLAAPEEDDTLADSTCEEAVLRYLRKEQQANDEKAVGELTRRWDRETLLGCLAGLQGRLPGNQAYLKCLRLSKELMKEGGEQQTVGAGGGHDEQAVAAQESDVPVKETIATGEDADLKDGDETVDPEGGSALDSGWSLYQGKWEPKPIGVV